MTRYNQPIHLVSIQSKINTGIEIVPEYEQLVAEYHVVEACKEYGYRYYHDWQELTPRQQSKIVAHYFLNRYIKAHQNDAENKYIERKNRGRR